MTNDAILLELNALEECRSKAVIGRDIALLHQMHSDQLMYCHSTGVIDSKKDFISKIAHGRSIFHAFMAIADAVSEPVEDMRLAAGNLSIDVEIANHLHHVRGRFFAAWCCRNGQWQLDGFQGVGG